MKVLLTRWGVLRFNPMLNYFINWDIIVSTIQNETYIYSIWFFKLVPKLFKDSYVIYIPDVKKHEQKLPREIETSEDVEKLLDKLEEKEGIEIPQHKRQRIIKSAVATFNLE